MRSFLLTLLDSLEGRSMHQSSCYPNVKKGKPHKFKNPECFLLPGGSSIPWVGQMERKALPQTRTHTGSSRGVCLRDGLPASYLPYLMPPFLPEFSQCTLGVAPSQPPLQHLSWEAKQRQISKGKPLGPSLLLLASSIITVTSTGSVASTLLHT